MGDANPRKRSRLDSETKLGQSSQEDVKVYNNHPTLYFDDGNIILSCSSKLFCVHRSVLSKHSSVLKAQFDSSEKSTLRGCRLFVMEDSAEDVEALLNVIYEGVGYKNLTVESFPLVSSTLRMCTKYKIDRPCAEILQRIKDEWPRRLPDHDAKMLAHRTQQAKNAPYILQNGVNVPNPQYDPANVEEDLIIHPGSVIALLRGCGYTSPEILAPLFYALSCGTWQFGGTAVGHHIAPLSHADIERFIIGIERLRMHHADAVTQLPSPIGLIPAGHVGSCWVNVHRYWTTLAPLVLRATGGSRQPIEDWLSVIQQARTNGKILTSYNVCPECAGMLVREMEKKREGLWTDIPTYFELHG